MSDREKALEWFKKRESAVTMPGARDMYREAIKALSEPEVILCEECIWWQGSGEPQGKCVFWGIHPLMNWYCGGAKRR